MAWEKGKQWQGRTQNSLSIHTSSPAVKGPARNNPSRLPWLTHVNQLLVFCAALIMPRSQSFSSSSQEPLGIGKQWHHEACSLDDALWRKSPYIWLWSKRNSRVQVVPCMAGLWAWLEVCLSAYQYFLDSESMQRGTTYSSSYHMAEVRS